MLLNKYINFNENEAESKLKNSTHNFREMNLLLLIFPTFNMSEGHLCFFSMYSVLNKL